jgi:hypothetical protein
VALQQRALGGDQALAAALEGALRQIDDPDVTVTGAAADLRLPALEHRVDRGRAVRFIG